MAKVTIEPVNDLHMMDLLIREIKRRMRERLRPVVEEALTEAIDEFTKDLEVKAEYSAIHQGVIAQILDKRNEGR